MDWYDSEYGVLGFCEYSNIFNFILLCAGVGWDGMGWHGVRWVD